MTYEKSASEISSIAWKYVATLTKTPDVHIDELTLHQADGIWEVQGTYRTNPFVRSRRFELQLSSHNGAIIGFTSLQRPSLAPILTGMSIILGTLLFLVWVFFLNK